jgi:FkbM family methyltransferase
MNVNASQMVDNPAIANEIHPRKTAQILRNLNFLRHVPGWNRFLGLFSGVESSGRFLVDNQGIRFEGDINNHIERALYFDGGYEDDLIELFLNIFSTRPRRVILDVGANIGTHSLAFSRVFSRVIAFEPSPKIFARLLKNLGLNTQRSVEPHAVGLAASKARLPFYDVSLSNDGLGTFLDVDQYGMPLEPAGELEVVRGDDFLTELGVENIDAIKIDIQGFEPEALMGLRSILSRDKPIVWTEIGLGTQNSMESTESFASLFPYPIDIYAFTFGRKAGINRTWLTPLDQIESFVGNVIVCPEGTKIDNTRIS